MGFVTVCIPLFDTEKGGLKVEIQNFGLSASEPTEVEVICNGSSHWVNKSL